MGHGQFSSTGFLTKEGRPAIIYRGFGTDRNQIAIAEDDQRGRWSKPIPINPQTRSGDLPSMRHWDPDCSLDSKTYYAISGGQDPHLMKSTDWREWEYIGRFGYLRSCVCLASHCRGQCLVHYCGIGQDTGPILHAENALIHEHGETIEGLAATGGAVLEQARHGWTEDDVGDNLAGL